MSVVNGNVNTAGIGAYNAKAPVTTPVYKNINDKFDRKTVNNNTVQNPVITNVNSLYSPKQLLLAYANTNYVNDLMVKNPKVLEILKQNGISPEINSENVTGIINSHLVPTTSIAMQLANKMGVSPVDKKFLEQAAMFHDFGKIIMPKSLINKPGALTPEEKNIINLHSQLGYELLSSTGMNKQVLELIKNHHIPYSENQDKLLSILSVADIYAALKEKRPYKNSMSRKEIMSILDQKANNGEVSPEVLNCLKQISLDSQFI